MYKGAKVQRYKNNKTNKLLSEKMSAFLLFRGAGVHKITIMCTLQHV